MLIHRTGKWKSVTLTYHLIYFLGLFKQMDSYSDSVISNARSYIILDTIYQILSPEFRHDLFSTIC